MIFCLLFLLFQTAAPESTPPLQKDSHSVVEHADVRSLLQSSDASRQAWGAWRAGQSNMRDTIPFLIMLVEKRLPEMKWKADEIPSADRYSRSIAVNASAWVVDAALDALIQLEAKLPANLISAIYEQRQAQALILLSKLDSDADTLLLNLVSRERGVKWFCAANMLLAHRTPGFTFFLLQDLSIKATLAISKDGSQPADRGGIGTGIGGGVAGPSTYPPEFPPHAYYHITFAKNAENVQLAPGPKWSIYYRRDVTASGSGITSTTSDIDGPNSEDRLQYISALGQKKIPLSAAEYKSVRWRGQKALESEKEKFKRDILARHSALVQKLVEANCLTTEEARTVPKPTIEMEIQDLR